MGIVRVTAMGPGSVEYLLKGCDAKQDQVLDGPDQARHGAAAYFEAGIKAGEPQGVWLGSGMAGLGLSMRAGDTAEAADVRAIFGQLRYPEREVVGSTEKTPVYLGSAPRKYRTAAQIVDDALKKEPDAADERKKEIERSATKQARTTHAWYDVTLSPVKSVSVYYTALLAGGDEAGAERVRQAHFEAIRIAVESVESELAYVRTGRHEGKGPGGRSVGTYEQSSGLSVAVFEHHTNRDGEPQLHAHAGVLARSATSDGSIYAIDGYGFKTITDRLTAAYTRAYQQLLTGNMEVLWGPSADGKTREIVGIDPQLCAEASTRTGEHVKPRVAELVEGYIARHGREPGAVARRALVQQAVKDTRSPKTGLAGPAAVAAWARGETGRTARLAAALDAVDAAVADAAMAGTHPNTGWAVAGQQPGHEHGQQVTVHGRQAALAVLAEIAAGQAVSGHEMTGQGSTGQYVSGQQGQHPAGQDGPVTVAGRVAAAIADGIGDVQAKYATWTAANLNRAIDHRLGDHAGSLGVAADQRPVFLAEVTAAVLAQPGRYGIVQVSAGDPVPVPDELRRLGPDGDGRSKYRPHSDERYATSTHISAEQRLLAGIQTPGGARLDDTRLAPVRERLAGQRLSPDQAAVVAGVLGSGRAADVLVGPAGTGKSHTVGALAREWDTAIGGRVIGVATAEIAARNLAGLGLEAYNTTRFTLRFSPDPGTGQFTDRLGPRDLIVVDEAGMSSTRELLAIAELADASGAKLLYTGDHRQLQPIGAGGMFAHLATQPGVLELDTVHRFDTDWEAHASLALRDGDPAAATSYVDHGRVRTGTAEEMKSHAVRGHVADLLVGTDAMLIVDSNQLAAELSQNVHDRLVEFGRVDPQVLFTLPDDTEIGVGDRILARRNNHHLRVDPGPDGKPASVTNKEVYEVLGRDRDGQLLARDEHGATAHLPKTYVDEHVSLAYAVTGHAAEGVTVHGVGRHLAGRDATRESLYTALTRATESNLLYLVTEHEPDAHQPQRIEDTPAQRLAEIIARSGADEAALTAREAAAEQKASMGMLGSLINQASTEYAHHHNAEILDQVLDEQTAAAVRGDRAYGQLLAVVYAAELDGHDPAALLGEAVQMKEFNTARSVAQVLHWRVGVRLGDRTPEHGADDSKPGMDWAAVAATVPEGPVHDYVAALTEQARQRQAELGAHVAAEPPDWARDRLPQLPEQTDPDAHQVWVERAGVVAAYREYRGIPATQSSLGEAPPEAQQFARALFLAAAEALDDDPTTAAWSRRSDAELYQAREAWAAARYQADTYGPRSVADDLANTHRMAAEIRDDAILARAEAHTHPAGDPRRTERAEAADRYQELAEQYEADAGQLETAHAGRAQWWEQNAPLREADQAAKVELGRRGLPAHRETEPSTPPEQLELVTVIAGQGSPTAATVQDIGREQSVAEHDSAEPTAADVRASEAAAPEAATAPEEVAPDVGVAEDMAVPGEFDPTTDVAATAAELDRRQPETEADVPAAELDETLADGDARMRQLRQAAHESRVEQARQHTAQPEQHETGRPATGYDERAAADQRAIEAGRRGQQNEPTSGLEPIAQQPAIEPDHEHGYDEYDLGYEYGEDYEDDY